MTRTCNIAQACAVVLCSANSLQGPVRGIARDTYTEIMTVAERLAECLKRDSSGTPLYPVLVSQVGEKN